MPLPNQSIPPAPASPEAVPGIPEAPVSGGLSQEQMKTNLRDMMAKIESKYQDFNSDKFSSDNQIKEQQSESLRQIFDLFQSAGVDLSNVEEVRAFLDDLRTKNPELSQQIEQVLQNVIGEDPLAQSDEAPIAPGPEGIPPGNMNINNEEPPQNL